MLVTGIFSFSHNIFYPFPEIIFSFSAMSILLSANAYNLDKSKNLSFGKEWKIQNLSVGIGLICVTLVKTVQNIT